MDVDVRRARTSHSLLTDTPIDAPEPHYVHTVTPQDSTLITRFRASLREPRHKRIRVKKLSPSVVKDYLSARSVNGIIK
ncbi:hypothetical protein L210DRAFT_2473127 [Boletus edulis BED1]|uniref:Uncharacterized protein n=1 Tax=Boletus edulis BED1 TaxID=1328754 RepID=A0AAD4BC56_BOLED|nr:hypothetical protein L210DRAFT_2473127 [Boletus edulis BED1]